MNEACGTHYIKTFNTLRIPIVRIHMMFVWIIYRTMHVQYNERDSVLSSMCEYRWYVIHLQYCTGTPTYKQIATALTIFQNFTNTKIPLIS